MDENPHGEKESKICKYCKKKANNGPICAKCGTIYHPSCSYRIRKCCNLEFCEISDSVATATVDNNQTTLKLFQELVVELRRSNMLLMQKNSQLEDIIIQKNDMIHDLQNKTREKKADTKTKVVAQHSIDHNILHDQQRENCTAPQIKDMPKELNNTMKTVAQHSTDHNALYTHQIGVMNELIHLTHSEDPNRKSTSPQTKVMQEASKTIKMRLEAEKSDEDPTFTLVTKRKTKQKNVTEERPSHQRHPKINQNVGKAPVTKEDEEKGFAAKNKKIWLHISHAKEHVTEKIVVDYLAKKTGRPLTEFMVKLLPTQKKKKDNNCFMVGVDPSLKDDVYKPEFWPNGIGWSRFNFFRGRRFLQEPA